MLENPNEKPRQQAGTAEDEDEDVKNTNKDADEEPIDWETLGRQKLVEVLTSWKERMEASLNFSVNQGDEIGDGKREDGDGSGEGEEEQKVRIKQESGDGAAGHEKQSNGESSRTVGRSEAGRDGERRGEGDADAVDVKMEEVG